MTMILYTSHLNLEVLMNFTILSKKSSVIVYYYVKYKVQKVFS